MVFVFATGTMMNASTFSSQNPDEFECAEIAWAAADQLQEETPNTLSDWDMWEITNFEFEQCMSGN